MSKIGLGRRMALVEQAAAAHDPLAYAAHHLPPDLRRKYDEWQDYCERIIANHERGGGRCRYELLMDGHNITPPMPRAVHAALWPNGETDHKITSDMTVAEAAELYGKMLRNEK